MSRARTRRERGQRMANDPFGVLGLDPGADLTDDDVRAAWRRIAAATHPDRADGGDPERFAIAAAAYTELRTRYGRGEARAALSPAAPADSPPAFRHGGLAARLRYGRPVRLAARVTGAAAAAAAALGIAGPGPAGPALAAGIATWLAAAIRRDLASPDDDGSS